MRNARILPLLGLAVALVSATTNASIAATEQAFIDLFGGSWAGSGIVVRGSVPWHVSCSAIGQSAPNRLIVEGTCSVSIVSVRIAADIKYDPVSGLYSGTYIGAKVGPAHVSGRSAGSVVNLAVTWPKPVNGDTKARMTIVNTGDRFRLTLLDNLTHGGPEVVASDVILCGGRGRPALRSREGREFDTGGWV